MTGRTKITVAVITGIVLFAIVATSIAAIRNRAPIIEFQGEQITNLEELLAEAEALHTAEWAGDESIEVASAENGKTLCFIATRGKEVTDSLACGLILRPGDSQGGYDTLPVTWEATGEGSYRGVLAADSAFTADGELPTESELRRPDGIQALPGDALKPERVVVVMSEASLPQNGTGRVESSNITLDDEVLQPLTTEPVQMRTPTGETSFDVYSAPTVLEDGKVAAPPAGKELFVVRGETTVSPTTADPETDHSLQGGITQPTKGTEFEVVVGGKIITLTADELAETIFLADKGDEVKVRVVHDYEPQEFVVTRQGVSEVKGTDKTAGLYEPSLMENDGYADSMDFTRWNVSGDDGNLNTSVSSVRKVAYLEGAGWSTKGAWVVAALNRVDGYCQDPYEDISEHVTFDEARASSSGTDLGIPLVIKDEASSTVSLAWEVPADAREIAIQPIASVYCPGGAMITYDAYSWTTPEDQVQPSSAYWVEGEVTDSDSE